jgi:hypothetical protein
MDHVVRSARHQFAACRDCEPLNRFKKDFRAFVPASPQKRGVARAGGSNRRPISSLIASVKIILWHLHTASFPGKQKTYLHLLDLPGFDIYKCFRSMVYITGFDYMHHEGPNSCRDALFPEIMASTGDVASTRGDEQRNS